MEEQKDGGFAGVISSENGKKKKKLVFAVNGERFELPNAHPSTTLLSFLRSHTLYKSPKLGCGEGGCGACVVLLSKYDPVSEQVEDYTVSACLTLLCSVNGCSVTTSEGLGNSRDGFHPIHQRFAGFHASQCGFCTPGMCVSLFSALINADKNLHSPEPPQGFSKLTVSEAERAVAGNLCRCTGYRPIADACKSFAGDVDIEDLGLNSFWKNEDSREVKVGKLPFYDPRNRICTYPEFLKSGQKQKQKQKQKSGIVLDSERYQWYCPVSLEELGCDLGENGERVKLVVGNTGMGYYKDFEEYDRYIDLRYISELSVIKRDSTGIEVGATVTISKLILNLREESEVDLGSSGNLILGKIADHMEKIGAGFIRNTASVGGNLVMAQKSRFPSDIATLLLALGSSVVIMAGHNREKIGLEEFFERPGLDSRAVVLSVWIPFQATMETGGSRLLFEAYRAAPRPLGNALPYVNAAFLADVCGTRNGYLINRVRLAFGAFGTKHAIRATKVEDYLTGKTLSVNVLYEALKLVKATVVPEPGTSHPEYRSSVIASFLFKFLQGFIAFDPTGNLPKSSEKRGLLSSGKQCVDSSKEYYPVGKPIAKSGAAIQASGEAVYVDDIPSPSNCLYGAFIYSTQPLAWVKGIKFKSDSVPDGVAAVITFKDIPSGGENIGSITMCGSEPLFADHLTRCAGDRIALVVADSQRQADAAARMAIVEYDTENLDPPILTVEDAVKKSSFFEVPPMLIPEKVGDFSKGMAEADHKILSTKISLGSQYFFYMETQTSLAIPDEDNCMLVYSSSQCPESAHSVIARCLGVPEHNIRVVTRRVGGGFGGKAVRAMPISTACALAAYKLNRPVRIYLDRKTDMIMAGGRHPMEVTYSVGFKSSGKITALHLEILINAGAEVDLSPVLPMNIIGGVSKYDWGALSFEVKVCKTNEFAKSFMRAPGELQGSFIAEAVMEHVASVVSVDVDCVRGENLHTFESLKAFYRDNAGELVDYTLPAVMESLGRSSGFLERTEMVWKFNQQNRWKKRGISRVPVVAEVLVSPTPAKVSILSDGSIVVELGGVELGQGLWTKVKQMAAFALSLALGCDQLEELVGRVRVVQSDTLSIVQGGYTSGSTTSESSCEAVRLCCNVLVERLSPVKTKLQDQTGSVDWNTLVLQAYNAQVNLAANSYYVPDTSSIRYLNYGAAVSEVEVDVLTGESRILRADITYDCGQSLNPAVDMGQIEGAFVQGVGFFMLEEYLTNADGLVVSDSTWTYKIPTIDTIPQRLNIDVLNTGHHKNRILSSKASGEPPLLLAASVHCATRAAIKEARKQRLGRHFSNFFLEVPATMPVVKKHCGLDYAEEFLEFLLSHQHN
ncbi:PREDICTED: abscisic-aldehyde oxidase-like [Ipomoea nil]|uniref:abscisic-aldehyde oxidase-like n=1 Tax=Ipomoea nil TaxID=35883 RepID=UPI000901DE32|nr:PREDICTED: abscisic-aldehyde oxidase-like [Ipomoea nil]